MKLRRKVLGVLGSVCALMLSNGLMGQEATNDVKVNGDLVVRATNPEPKLALFYTVDIDSKARVDASTIYQESQLTIKKLQGKNDMMTVALSRKLDGMVVTGANNALKAWAIREMDGKLFLDLQVNDSKSESLTVVVKGSQERKEGVMSLMTFGPNSEVKNLSNAGFNEKVKLSWDTSLAMRTIVASGFVKVKENAANTEIYLSKGMTQLSIEAPQSYAGFGSVDLRNLDLAATVSEDKSNAVVTLTGELHVREVTDEWVTLLAGKVGLLDYPEIVGLNLNMETVNGEVLYKLIPKQVGVYPVKLKFGVAVENLAGWKTMRFKVPNGAVIPLQLSGVEENAEFKKSNINQGGAVTELQNIDTSWQGVLSASGACMVQWKPKSKSVDGELFYTSSGIADVRIGAGLMNSVTTVRVKILQGKMSKLVMDLDGEGEVMSVIGSQIASWKVNDVAGKRVLECVLNSARSEVGSITVASQYPLGKLPAKVQVLRLTPQGAIRHSGYVRVLNDGAVRLESTKVKGLLQLSPELFPSARRVNKDVKSKRPAQTNQVLVYRYPTAERSLEISADQIISEVGVSQVLVYELGDTDRVIYADVELDIREASLREWGFQIPADYAVSAVKGAEMADYVVSSTVESGMRNLKIIFKNEVIGRQLVQLKLEKNLAARAGDWSLAPLKFPKAITVKGDIGVQAAHGWKVTETKIKGLKSRALAYFPKRSETLQQAYRVRGDDWSVAFKIEEMGQSVQADLFHLYEQKEGMLEAKVLVNYFVIGAPSSQWSLSLPVSAENVSVEGQNVRSWDYTDGKLVVSLHQPALGAATLLVTYEEAMLAGGGTVELGGVTPIDVQSESGFIHLVSSNQVKHRVLKGENQPLSISPLEMPMSFQVLSSKPSIAAWQYASRPFGLKLNIETLELVETVDQVVGAATLDTKVTRSGEVVTSAKFLVMTRGKKALRMRLPANNKLWSAKADNAIINARVDDGEYILPIPATTDPNRYRVVEIRYGGTSENPEKVNVGPPELSAPMTIAEWKISGDNHLVVTGGNVKPLQTVVQATGFDWVSARMTYLIGVLMLFLGGVFLTQKLSNNNWMLGFGTIWLLSVVLFSSLMAIQAASFDVTSLKEFNVVAPVVESSEVVSLQLRNSERSLGIFSTSGVILMLLGFAGFVVCNLRNLSSLLKALALLILCIGALMNVGGASYFYFIIAVLALMQLVRAVQDFRSRWDGLKQTKTSKLKTSGATAMLAFVMSLAGLLDSHADSVANSINELWTIKQDKLTSTMNLKWSPKAGESIVVLREPATLVSHSGDGYRVVKAQHPNTKQIVWSLVAEKEGEINVQLNYQMAMPNPADQAWLVPSGVAAVKTLNVNIDQRNWKITATNSVLGRQVNVPNNGVFSSANLVLIGNLQSSVMLKPMPRNREKEKLRFFAEMADIYIPAAGVLDGRHKLKIRPLSGELSELVLDVPKGMMVGDVLGNVVDSWRFDAKRQTLTVTLQNAISKEFELSIMTQRGLKAFPQQVLLETMKVRGVENVVGMLAYGFGSDSQPDDAKVKNLLEVNSSDFNAGLITEAKTLQPAYVLHKAYRYGKDYGSVDLKIAAVAPEIRVHSRQALRMNEEQVSLQIEAAVNIIRAGVFDLKFAVPKGFNVETVGGAALRDWSESEVAGKRVVTMFLNGKTMGEQRFVVTMLGAAPKANEFNVPKWELENVERQKGVLMVIPDHGIRLQVSDRTNVSQLDLSKNGQSQQGALSFRLLQKDWKLQLSVQKLDAWVTAEMLQELSLKEGVTNNRLRIIYKVENAVVKSFRIRLKGVEPTGDKGKTLRASGAVVKDMVHLEGDIWEIRLKQGVIGNVPVTVEYQEVADRKENKEVIAPVELLDVKQVQHYVVVRAPGRLDMQQTTPVRSWRVVDWFRVPEILHNPADKSVPSLSYKLTDSDKSITVMVKRHAMAGTLKLRVEKAEMKTLFNVDGSALTRLSMAVRVVEKSSLRVALPPGSRLLNIIVNDESVAVVKEDDAYWFLIDSSANDSMAAKVKVTYLTDVPADSVQNKVKLLGPSLNIPLEKIDWFVMLPDGYDYSGFNGGFDFVELQELGSRNYVSSYVAQVKTRYKRLKEEGQKELEMAMNWSNNGELDKANKAFNRVYQNGAVDAASNEDAKVKLEQNMTSQAIMGLNTRRQRIYMDNQAAGNQMQRNNLLEKAATNNPFFAGSNNFDPNQLRNYMLGNSQEEINAMSRIAKKLVGTQLQAGNTTQGIDLELLDSSKVLHVYRDVYLPGDQSLVLEVDLKDGGTSSKGDHYGLILLLLAVAALGGWMKSLS